MINQKQENQKMTMDLSTITSFLDMIKKYIHELYNFFKDNKNNSKIMLIIALATSGLALYFGIQLYSDITVLNGKSSELVNIASYDTRILEADATTKTILQNADTIKDLLQENQSVQGEISKYTDYLHALQIPYTYLLKYIYLPSLNVWKENYTDKIDTDLI
ncbi:MAG: hypothetical protein WCL02_02345 [bacterium]